MRDYILLMKIPGAWRLILSSIPGRLSYGMSGLALFFHVQTITGRVSTAGIAVGLYSGFSAATASIRGHAVDRWGQTKPLSILVPGFTLACFALSLWAKDGNSAMMLSALIGLTAPPINLSVRPLWKQLAGDEMVRTAYALDTVVLNTTGLFGPVLGTWTALHFSGMVAMQTTGLLMLLGGLLLLSSSTSRSWEPEAKNPDEPGLFKSAAMRVLAFEGLLIGLGYGLLDVAVPSAATLAGVKDWAAVSLAAISFGGLIGGVIAGSQFKHWAPARGLVITQYAFALFAFPLFAISPGLPTALLLLAAGFPLGMAQVFYLEVVDLVRPRGAAVAALGTIWFIEGSAGAAGNALAGVISENFGSATALVGVGILFLASAATLHWASTGPLAPAMNLTGAESD